MRINILIILLFVSSITYSQNKITIRSGTISGSSGSSFTDSVQTHTSGSSLSVNNTVNIVYINPISVIDTLTITLPLTPATTKEIEIYFGGTITVGAVVNNLFIAPNMGQSIIELTSPGTVYAGEMVTYKYNSSLSKWFRK